MQIYCNIVYSRSGINQMWILKNSKQLLDNLHSNYIASVNSIKTFDFSTLYTSIPHDQLKSRLASIVNQAVCLKMERNDMNILLLSTIPHILLKVIPMRNTSTQKTTLLE